MRYQDRWGHLLAAVVLVGLSWLGFGLRSGLSSAGWVVSALLWVFGGAAAAALGRRLARHLVKTRSRETPYEGGRSALGLAGALGAGVIGPATAPLLSPLLFLPAFSWFLMFLVGSYGPIAVRADELFASRSPDVPLGGNS